MGRIIHHHHRHQPQAAELFEHFVHARGSAHDVDLGWEYYATNGGAHVVAAVEAWNSRLMGFRRRLTIMSNTPGYCLVKPNFSGSVRRKWLLNFILRSTEPEKISLTKH